MREITRHKINGLNNAIRLIAFDEPGAGGASHNYGIAYTKTGPSTGSIAYLNNESFEINFQKGPPAVDGINGISNEVLLAVLIDRLEGFQSGPFKSQRNGMVLSHLHLALEGLHGRTLDRLERGVEGTLNP